MVNSLRARIVSRVNFADPVTNPGGCLFFAIAVPERFTIMPFDVQLVISMIDWHIQSRAHACQSCGEAFRDRVGYHTLLFDDKRELKRMDICAECYTKQYAEARDQRGFVSHWQGVYEAPPPVAPDAIRKDTAEDLLRRLVELNDPRYRAASYILAVMLERKRLLRVKEQLRQGSSRTFIYEQPKTGDIFTIPDPELQLDQLEVVQRMVADLLEHGIAPDGSIAAPAAAPPGAPADAASTAAEGTEGAPTTGTTAAADGSEPAETAAPVSSTETSP